MQQTRGINIVELIDKAPVSRLQKWVIGLCLVLAILDGFDAQVIGFALPALAADWGVPPASFGILLAGSTSAMVVGSMVFGPLADRYGRRIIIIVCTVVFSVFTLSSALADSMQTLIILRFLAGLGLGGVTPNLVALASEYAPGRIRSTVVTVVVAGMSLGGFLGAFLAASFIPVFGWQGLFVAGGILPLLALIPTFAKLPESVKFLAARGQQAKTARILNAIDPHAAVTSADTFELGNAATEKTAVAVLFERGSRLNTALLWAVFLINFLVIYFLLSWMPSLFTQAGLAPSVALMAAACYNLGGMTGALVLGRITDKTGNAFAVVMGGYSLGALFIVLVAVLLGSVPLVMVTIFIVGLGMGGSSAGIIALAAVMYPVNARATGVGWALGIGRLGSILGPSIGAVLIGIGLAAMNIFTLMAIPTVLAVVVLAILSRRSRRALPEEAALAPAGLQDPDQDSSDVAPVPRS